MEGQREVKVKSLQKEILIYHGTMRVWNPIQSMVNPNPVGIPDHQEPLKQKQERSSLLLRYVLSVRGTMMKEKHWSVSPQPIKSDPQVDKSETRVKEKWNSMDRKNNVDKDTEKWVEEQNTFFEKKREKQGDEFCPRFDPKRPVTILQRRHYASVPVSSQVPQRLKDSKCTQSQPNNEMVGHEGTWYRREFGAGYNPKSRKWSQGNGYRKRYGTKEKKGTGRS